MNRNDAWQQYKPQIEIKKNSFNGLYKNLENEPDCFSKAEMCGKVWRSATELLEKLEYGRIINPKEEAAYQDERDKISKVPVIFAESAVFSAFKDCGTVLSFRSKFCLLGQDFLKVWHKLWLVITKLAVGFLAKKNGDRCSNLAII